MNWRSRTFTISSHFFRNTQNTNDWENSRANEFYDRTRFVNTLSLLCVNIAFPFYSFLHHTIVKAKLLDLSCVDWCLEKFSETEKNSAQFRSFTERAFERRKEKTFSTNRDMIGASGPFSCTWQKLAIYCDGDLRSNTNFYASHDGNFSAKNAIKNFLAPAKKKKLNE